MADPIKFIQLDCHLDEKFEYIEAEFGLTGFAVIVKLFQRIYGGEGYYCEWSERAALLFARKESTDVKLVKKIVGAAIGEGIFDGDMFARYGILTSRGIQKRFADVAKRRSQIFDKPEYVIGSITPSSENVCDLSPNVNNSGSDVCNSQQNVCNETASKVKRSKAKQSKAKRSEVKQSESAGENPVIGEPTALPREPELPVTHARTQNIDRDFLVDNFGENQVVIYEGRFNDWRKHKQSINVRMYEEIFRWMLQDNVAKKPRESSFDMDEVMEKIVRHYRH